MIFRVLLANILWFLSCLPSRLAFAVACRTFRRSQKRVLRRILAGCRANGPGGDPRFSGLNEDAFHRLPFTDYDQYREPIAAIRRGQRSALTADPVYLLQPTSGTTTTNKLIPYTEELRREFHAAVAPWIAQLYLSEPRLFAGRQYWCVSPSTMDFNRPDDAVPVRFADDTEYLGMLGCAVASALMAVPPSLARVRDSQAFRYLTLLFLLRERNLRLISVWHPSFLTVLLDALPGLRPAIAADIRSGRLRDDISLDPDIRHEMEALLAPDPKRAAAIERTDLTNAAWPAALWPRVCVISCWTDGNAGNWVAQLAQRFPGARIQGKGLAATEGIVSFPLGFTGRKVLAVRSHYLEFESLRERTVCGVEGLREGERYAVILTTGGGLRRYRLHDVVEVTGFHRRTPCVRFLWRDNVTSDQVGEKLSLAQVEAGLKAATEQMGAALSFALVSPEIVDGHPCYVLFGQGRMPRAATGWKELAEILDREWRSNCHYDHARQLGQLGPVRVAVVSGDATGACRRHLAARGVKEGDMKIPTLDPHGGWWTVLGSGTA